MGKETQPVMVTKKFDAGAPYRVLLSPRHISTSQMIWLGLIFTLFLVEVRFVMIMFPVISVLLFPPSVLKFCCGFQPNLV